MASRFTRRLEVLVALALLGSAIACGDARPVLSQQQSAQTCLRCHGQPPETNAHLAHTTLASSGVPHASLACLNCHRDVQAIDGPDHILRNDGKPVGGAEVRFDDPESLGNRTQAGATRNAAAAYDPATRTCSNVYCHGATLSGAAPQFVATVAWTAPAGSVSCGTCHGIPPANHPAGITLADCTTCHGAAIDAAGKPNPTTHVNGTVDLSDAVTSRSCSGCHGDRSANVLPGDPRSAPPGDAQGRADSNAVGAHQNHVVAGVLGTAVACSECHVVPASLLAPGHLDNQVTVTFGALAKKGGLAPSYDAATQTCSNVYCHGNFPNSRTSAPPAPAWRAGAAAVACGSCHGTPPPAPAHPVVDVVAQGCSTRDPARPTLACHPGPGVSSPGFSFNPGTGTGTVDVAVHIDGNICLTDANGVKIPGFCGP
jgi:predicted CxxxxCH...CXXCH cytochrome family protein